MWNFLQNCCKESFQFFSRCSILASILLYSCLFTYNYFCIILPSSFDTFFTLCSELHNKDTGRQTGCVFVPPCSSKRYGRKYIKLSRILNRNYLSEVLNQDLLSHTKPKLKNQLLNTFSAHIPKIAKSGS